jgi:ferrous iron transport protein B
MKSLLLEGVLTSVGGVLVFVPSLFMMHFLLAALENSGYLARAAFVMDRFMSKVGLHGKSFIPMILGFGCNVPAIYATRTIEKREARLLTGLLIPFMSCSARLPVYLIFGLAFFPDRANLVIFILYLLGIFVAAGIALIISRLLFKDAGPSILVMELAPYRLPKLKPIFRYAWGQTAEFIKNAGTVIVVFSMALWLALNLPWGTTDPKESIYGQFSTILAPTLAPPGFGEWEQAGALVTGIIAKEMVISSLAQVYHIPQDDAAEAPETFWADLADLGRQFIQATLETGQEILETLTPGITLFKTAEDAGQGNLALSRALQSAFTPLSAASFLVFVLLYVPCVATVSAQRQEFGNQWAALSVAITLLVPWIMATIVYQSGRLLGLG